MGELCYRTIWWSWRESNPRPNKQPKCFLHAYPLIGFRTYPGKQNPRHILSSVFKCPSEKKEHRSQN